MEKPLTNGRVRRDEEWSPEAQLSQWLKDIHLMKAYATAEGMAIPASAAQRLAELTDQYERYRSQKEPQVTTGGLISITLDVHSIFAAIVAPATPRSLAATDGDQTRTARAFQNSLVVSMLVLTLVGLAVFVVGIIKATPGSSELWKQFSYFGAAILGATFYSLFAALKYVISRTFDPQYVTTYIVRLLLGIVAGVILANFGKDLGANLNGVQLGGPLFALIGGYSAEVVNQILMRVSETLLAAIKGNGSDQVKAKEGELKAAKAQALVENEKDRADIADQVAALASDSRNLQPVDIAKRLDDLKEKLRKRTK